MKVYVVSKVWYSNIMILSAFDSQQKADMFAEQHSKQTKSSRENYNIDEMDVK